MQSRFLFDFLERTVRPICFRQRASWSPCATFAVLWLHVCAVGLSAASWLEQRRVWERLNCPGSSTPSLCHQKAVRMSLVLCPVSVFGVCLYHLLLTPEKGSVISPCRGVISGVLERQQSPPSQIGLLASKSLRRTRVFHSAVRN